MASYPYELAQDAAYQSHTSRLTELWSLPRPAQGLNTNNNNNNNNKYKESVHSVRVKCQECNAVCSVVWPVQECVVPDPLGR